MNENLGMGESVGVSTLIQPTLTDWIIFLIFVIVVVYIIWRLIKWIKRKVH
jgi:hypothetical protein